MAAHDSDQNKIDVSLNIMSEATLAAVNNLTAQLETLRGFLASQAQQQANPAAQAASAGTWVGGYGTGVSYSRPGETQAGIFHGVSGGVQQGEQPNPTEGAQKSRERAAELKAEYKEYESTVRSGGRPEKPLSEPAESLMSHQMSDWDKWTLAKAEKKNPNLPSITSQKDQFFKRYQGSSRDPNEDRTYEGEVQAGGQSSMPDGMGPPARGPTTGPTGPGWSQTLQRDGISESSNFGMTVPRLGEFTTQDKLRMGARIFGRAAQRAEKDGEERMFGGMIPTAAVGRGAATASYLADNAAVLTSLHRAGQKVKEFAGSQDAAGAALGYSTDTGVHPDILGLGFRLNLPGMSEASREGWHQEITQRRVAAAGGVNTEQAKEIRATVGGMGYSDKRNEDLQFNLFKRLQQRGIAPGTFSQNIDQGFRQGNMSIDTLKDSVIGLSEAARHANMTVEQAASATLEYSESMQALGANYEKTMQDSQTFMTAGMDPRLAAKAIQSPLVGGILSGKTGLPQSLNGVAGPGMIAESITEAWDYGMNAGEGLAARPDIVTRSVDGQVIDRVTGKDQQIALAAQASGVDRQIGERLERNPNFMKSGFKAAGLITKMGKQISDQRHGRREVADAGPGGARSYYNTGQKTEHDTQIESYSKDLTKKQRAALWSGSHTDDKVQFDEVINQMRDMDPSKNWQAKVTKLAKSGGHVEDRLTKAKKMVGEATNIQKEPEVLLGLTSDAKKLVKQVKKKPRKKANSGGSAPNHDYVGPDIPADEHVGPTEYGEPDHE